jgi:hypothetical protein
MTRPVWIAAILLTFAPFSNASDTVRIAEIGVKGYYLEDRPTRIGIVLSRQSPQPIAVDLRIRVHSYPAPHVERVDTFTQRLPLSSDDGQRLTNDELRLIYIPVLLQSSQGASVEVDELDDRGQVLSHDATFLEAPLQAHLIGILCAKPDICQQIQSQVSFSGSSGAQTDKGKYLKFVTIENPPEASWQYSAVGTLIVARPPWQMEPPQRDALENFARRGGALILLDDQAHDPSFLSAYRPVTGNPGSAVVGRGKVFYVPSLASNVLEGLYSGADLPRALSGWCADGPTNDELGWIRRRLSFHFRFPSLTWLLVWLSIYVLIAGVGNFILLRKLNRREWGWITLPAISSLFAGAMYLSSVSSRPRVLRIDEVTVNWMDELSPVAFVERGERISSNRRQKFAFNVEGNVILLGDRDHTGDRVSTDPFNDEPQNSFPRWSVAVGPPVRLDLAMLQWSFRDLEFAGVAGLAGTVRRVDATHLRNETGKTFRQAMYVDRSAVYLFNGFLDGSILDLATADKKPLDRFLNGRLFAASGFPTGLAELSTSEIVSMNEKSSSSNENAAADWSTAKNVANTPFDLTELIRGWPPSGGHAFDARSALFFGLAEESHPPVAISGKQYLAEGRSITIVSYERKP